MTIRNIRLFNFRNYEDETVAFGPRLNCFLGENGAGKTNLIDAIHYLSLTKSAFNTVDKDNIREGEKQFMIKGTWMADDGKSHEIVCSYLLGKGKTFMVDQTEYDKISRHVGKFPVVLLAPNDTDLIREGSEQRRKFFDAILCQADPLYMEDLITYNHLLRQRNALLKLFGERHYFDRQQLDIYTSRMIAPGDRIYQVRLTFLEEFARLFQNSYEWISGGQENISLQYKSEGSNGHANLMEENVSRDRMMERTTAGVHRDDYHFRIERRSLKKSGSQGQQKSFVIALKMTQFAYLREHRGSSPLLLLDDIFDKLDGNRMERLMESISQDRDTQVFITDARPERTKEIMQRLGLTPDYFQAKNGHIL